MQGVNNSACEPSAQCGMDGMREIGYTRESFEHLPACGLCDRNNLKTRYLRRGRLPSGCVHLPRNLSGQRIDVSRLAGLLFKSC